MEDPTVLALVDGLREAMGIARQVEVGELAGLSTPSAVGWRRPLIVLPGDWRGWDESERRAVIAHELAHIARADYAAWIVARVGLALHFYHPLVHWTVSRLHLQQELAADAHGARLAGGRHPYLLALARLALRQAGCPMAWPARTLLAGEGHLIRRISVLNAHTPAKDGSLPVAMRALALASLVAVALGAATLRSPAPSLAADVPPGSTKPTRPHKTTSAHDPQPLDLTYIPVKATGYVALRPAQLFQRPDMVLQRNRLNALLAKVIPDGSVKLESIDQATVGLFLRKGDRKKRESGRLMLSGFMIRSVGDCDWRAMAEGVVKLVEEGKAKLVEAHHRGHTYYKITKAPKFGPNGCLYFPDKRTLVLQNEDELQRLIERGAAPRRAERGDAETANRCLMVVAIDSHGQPWETFLEPEPELDTQKTEPEELRIGRAITIANRWVVGLEAASTMKLRAIATCDTDQHGRKLAEALESLLALTRTELEQLAKTPVDKPAQAAERMAGDMAGSCQVHRHGSVVRVDTESRITLVDLVALLCHEGGLF